MEIIIDVTFNSNLEDMNETSSCSCVWDAWACSCYGDCDNCQDCCDN